MQLVRISSKRTGRERRAKLHQLPPCWDMSKFPCSVCASDSNVRGFLRVAYLLFWMLFENMQQQWKLMKDIYLDFLRPLAHYNPIYSFLCFRVYKQMSFSAWFCVDSGARSAEALRPHWRRRGHRRRPWVRPSGGRCSCFPASGPPEWSLHCGSGHRCFRQGCSLKTKHWEAS